MVGGGIEELDQRVIDQHLQSNLSPKVTQVKLERLGGMTLPFATTHIFSGAFESMKII